MFLHSRPDKRSFIGDERHCIVKGYQKQRRLSSAQRRTQNLEDNPIAGRNRVARWWALGLLLQAGFALTKGFTVPPWRFPAPVVVGGTKSNIMFELKRQRPGEQQLPADVNLPRSVTVDYGKCAHSVAANSRRLNPGSDAIVSRMSAISSASNIPVMSAAGQSCR
jgi:hypothetical protein